MIHKEGTVEIGLDRLAAIAPFIVAVDGQMTVRWASDPVLAHLGDVRGTKISEWFQAPEPKGEWTAETIQALAGSLREVLLKGEGSAVRLAGRWMPVRGGFVLMALPDVKSQEDLADFSFEDFPDNDSTLALMTMREEHAISLEEAKASTRALREARLNLEAVFETMVEGLVVLDPNGKILRSNPAARRILGLEDGGCDYPAPGCEVLHPDGTSRPLDETAVMRALREKRAVHGVEEGLRKPGGVVTWIQISAAPIMNLAGDLERVVCTFGDVTQRKAIEEKLKQSLAETERMNRLMTGREGRVVEMKKEVNALLEELGRERKYLKDDKTVSQWGIA